MGGGGGSGVDSATFDASDWDFVYLLTRHCFQPPSSSAFLNRSQPAPLPARLRSGHRPTASGDKESWAIDATCSLIIGNVLSVADISLFIDGVFPSVADTLLLIDEVILLTDEVFLLTDEIILLINKVALPIADMIPLVAGIMVKISTMILLVRRTPWFGTEGSFGLSLSLLSGWLPDSYGCAGHTSAPIVAAAAVWLGVLC